MFADASMWSGVIAELQGHEIPVVAPANPLRGVASDAAYIASFVSQIDGPVVLVGHSYGGAVITVAGTADNVVGLVYIAAHVLDEGESVDDLQGAFPDVPLTTNMHKAPFPIEGASEPGVEVSITPDAFPAISRPTCPAKSPRSWRYRSARSPMPHSPSRPVPPPGRRSPAGHS
ncbi:MAG: alpha/beta hydrolase fold protein [Actinomycetia bacterium]|nr:alpha/beta hydrolase fold protein [Actinomycetes bacterium]